MGQDPKPSPRSETRRGPEVPLGGSLLVQQGIITNEEYASALSRSEQSGHSIWTALRGASLILPGWARPGEKGGPSNEAAPLPPPLPGDGPTGAAPAPFGGLDASSPIPLLVSGLFEGAARWGATDIHFDPTPAAVRVRARIDGLLHDVGSLPDDVARHVRSRIKVLAGMDLVEKREPQDGHVFLQDEAGRRDFRVATLLTGLGERMVVRSHQVADQGHSLDALGLEDEEVAAVRQLLAKPHGLVLVAGPTGSGKTTTLYACLRALAEPTRSLLTIEDPIEYRLEGVTQVEVHPKLGLSFARGLRAILRQDPDVIMVGEIRDRDTARIASRAAAAGAFVLSTAHAADGLGVLRTLANYQVPPRRIGESLGGIVVQRLVRTLCDCKRPTAPNRASTTMLASWGLGDEECGRAKLYEPAGCPRCLGTGYRGRTGIFEVIKFGEPVGQRGGLIRGGSRWAEAITVGRSCDLLRSAARKIAAGTTTFEEVRRLLPVPHQERSGPPSASPTEETISS
jgi:type II secretory ATPase GspE/PulE/Tfp pilus assembly ATPase PilB-like protein